MIIKKVLGKTEEEAVEAAKKELGNGIVIMNVRSVKRKGLLGVFRSKLTEVTVALEDEQEVLEKVHREPALPPVHSTKTEQGGKISLTSQRTNADSIEKKLDSLQTLLEKQLNNTNQEERMRAETSQAEHGEAVPARNAGTMSQSENAQMTAKQVKNPAQSQPQEAVQGENPEQDKFIRLLYNAMIDNEVDEKYANQILEEIDKSKKPNIPIDYILANVYQKMILKFGKSNGITPAEKGPKVVVFLGPTGVGKTTTIAKVASNFTVEEKKKVALITSDTYRIAAAEQLRTYANILEVPFRVIYTVEEMQKAIVDFKEYDYIFLDTAGHSHQNEEQLQKMKELLDAISELAEKEAFLVLSATTKYRDLLKISKNYQSITQYQLIFTKLDETSSVGNLLNLKLYTEAPIAYVTYGQNVPDDIEVFNPQKTVKQLLGGRN